MVLKGELEKKKGFLVFSRFLLLAGWNGTVWCGRTGIAAVGFNAQLYHLGAK